MKKYNYFLYFLITFIIILIPSILIYLDMGLEGIARTFAADSYYYFSVANKYNALGYFSYDGINPTNGFHPLWQYLLTIAFKFSNSQSSQLLIAYSLSAILVALGYSFIYISILKLTKNPILPFIGLIPGFYYIIFGIIDSKFLSSWSYINGMESGLSIFFFGLLLFGISYYNWLKDINYYKIFALSLTISFIFLSRLDDIFLLIPFALILLFNSKIDIKIRVIAFSIPTIILFLYLLYNYSYADVFMPVSGTNKTSFTVMNIVHFINTILPLGLISDKYYYTWNNWAGGGYRILQNIIPIILYASILTSYFKFGNFKNLKDKILIHINQLNLFSTEKQIIFIIALYSLIKALHSLLFINIWFQGAWYFPLIIIGINITLILKIQKKVTLINKLKSIKIIIILLILIYAIRFANLIGSGHDYKEQNKNFQSAMYYKFWENRDNLQSELEKRNITKIIELDDGIMSFSLNINCISGTGLSLDSESNKHIKSGDFLNYMYSKDIMIIGTQFYLNLELIKLDNQESINKYFRNMCVRNFKINNPSEWEFNIEFYDEKTKSLFVRFNKKGV